MSRLTILHSKTVVVVLLRIPVLSSNHEKKNLHSKQHFMYPVLCLFLLVI